MASAPPNYFSALPCELRVMCLHPVVLDPDATHVFLLRQVCRDWEQLTREVFRAHYWSLRKSDSPRGLEFLQNISNSHTLCNAVQRLTIVPLLFRDQSFDWATESNNMLNTLTRLSQLRQLIVGGPAMFSGSLLCGSTLYSPRFRCYFGYTIDQVQKGSAGLMRMLSPFRFSEVSDLPARFPDMADRNYCRQGPTSLEITADLFDITALHKVTAFMECLSIHAGHMEYGAHFGGLPWSRLTFLQLKDVDMRSADLKDALHRNRSTLKTLSLHTVRLVGPGDTWAPCISEIRTLALTALRLRSLEAALPPPTPGLGYLGTSCASIDAVQIQAILKQVDDEFRMFRLGADMGCVHFQYGGDPLMALLA